MKSIRRRLLITIVLGALVLPVEVGLVSYLMLREFYQGEFDDHGVEYAMRLATMVWEEQGRLIFEFDDHLFESEEHEYEDDWDDDEDDDDWDDDEYEHEWEHFPDDIYFQIWTEDGRIVVRSPTLKDAVHLPRRHGSFERPAAWDMTLPDGEAGRAVGVMFSVPVDEESPDRVDPDRPKIIVVFAERYGDLGAWMEQIPLALLLGALLVFAVVVLLSVHFIRAGLNPLSRFASDLKKVDAETLHQRVDTASLPTELQSIGTTINSLLSRLESAFDRERRTTSNVAHELRTPIAELRTLTEVAQRSPDDDALARTTIKESHAVARQMERLVTALLQMARSQQMASGQIEHVQLAEIVEKVVSLYQPHAEKRAIHMTRRVPADLVVAADRGAVELILGNFISNAAAYCPSRGVILCEAQRDDQAIRLMIENTNEGLTEEDLPRLIEPFWRKDEARTDGTNAGLGMTLAAELCRASDIQMNLAIIDDRFRVTLTLKPVKLGPDDAPSP